jgi:hypothetical protein
MSCKILKIKNSIVVEYTPDSFTGNPNWLSEYFKTENDMKLISKTFFITKQKFLEGEKLHLKGNSEYGGEEEEEEEEFYEYNPYYFIIGSIDSTEKYYEFDKEILGISFNLYIDINIDIIIDFFYKNQIRIFSVIDSCHKNENLYIVQDKDYDDKSNNCIPLSKFEYYLKHIPTNTEINLYKQSRFSSVFKNYLEVDDYETKLEKHISNKLNKPITNKITFASPNIDIAKYEYHLTQFGEMLKNHSIYQERE